MSEHAREGGKHPGAARLITGLCIECALRHHEFSEVTGRPCSDGHPFEASLPEAWIDGRRHGLLPSPGPGQMACRECRRGVGGVYRPIE